MESFIPAEYYRYVYLGIAFILVALKTGSWEPLRPEEERTSYRKALFLGIFFIFFFGLRPEEWNIFMTDTYNYVSGYDKLKENPALIDLQETPDKEILWDWLQNNMARLGFSAWVWLTVVATIYIIPNIWGAKRLFPNHTYLAFLFYVVFFLFYSGGINGIRNADAYSLVFLGLTLLVSPTLKNYLICMILCLIGYQFHSSVLITILAAVLAMWVVKRTDIAIGIWLASIIAVLLTGTTLAEFASTFTEDERAIGEIQDAVGADILNGGMHNLRFRWDFLLFSVFPILVGTYALIVKQVNDNYYRFLLNTYILANAFWIIFMYAQYSNRFAMLSWCIYPYVLCYPFIKFDLWHPIEQNRNTNSALWIMMIFTLYMSLW
ncbi:MAG: hypothetical protein HDS67_05520 [Bacteroidales bacterium]|nr:hypothetical protein [Bacteroidales bacterium]